jgi:primosomal protein N' (replication factor Y) (superfamily II helicase)
MKIVTIVPLQKGVFRGDLTYFTSKDTPLGSVVTAPVRSKKILGLVVSEESVSGAKMNIKEMDFDLRKIIEVKERSIFLKEYLVSMLQTCKYFAKTRNNPIASLVPNILQEKYDEIAKFSIGTQDSGMVGVKDESTAESNARFTASEKLLLQAPLQDRITIHKTLIRATLAKRESVFVVLPTIEDIETFHGSLSKGIEKFTFILHSGLTKKKALQSIEQIMGLEHSVLILGTAPYLSIPRLDMKCIIIEHESSPSFRLISEPYIDLRTFVELFASSIKAKLILCDTQLRFETLARGDKGELVPMHPPSFRISFDGKISVENPRAKANVVASGEKKNTSKTKFKIFSNKTLEKIQDMVTHGKSVFVFTLRKGLATQTMCRDCGHMVTCEECSLPVVLYYSAGKKNRMFVCNKCQRNIGSDSLCKECGSWNLVPLGIGTDTVCDELAEKLPGKKIHKLDKDIARTKTGAMKIITGFSKNEGSILVGTEMALFYMRDKVPLSIVASFDSLRSIPSFKISEKMIQLTISILSKTSDELIIETQNDQDPAIASILRRNLSSFVHEEIEDRKNLHYPPFKRFIKITYQGNKEETDKAKASLARIFEGYSPEIFSGFIAKLKGKYTTNALIKMDPSQWSLPEILPGSNLDKNLATKLSSLPPEFKVSVDPEDLL